MLTYDGLLTENWRHPAGTAEYLSFATFQYRLCFHLESLVAIFCLVLKNGTVANETVTSFFRVDLEFV